MRGALEICGCFPTGRHYPGIADRLAAARSTKEVRGLAPGFDAAMGWAAAPLAIVDFETTGLDEAVDRVIEMGIVCVDDGRVTSSHSWLFNPEMPVPEASTAVHGITDEKLADQPRFAEVWSEIEPHLTGRLPVAYNAPFDKKFLLAELGRAGKEVWGEQLPPAMQSEVVWIDPIVWVRELFPEEGAKLTDICKYLGIELEGAHRATNDAEATGKVLFSMTDRMPQSYGELIRVQARYAAQQNVDLAIWRGRRF